MAACWSENKTNKGKEDKILFWIEGYHGEQIMTKEFYASKLNYIHQNPVRAGVAEKEEVYLLSSCGELCGVRKGLLELAIYLFIGITYPILSNVRNVLR